ncbi:MAG: NAD-dependent epimerase/dehydratase family protein [Deltaproteobacteria bacterium]|nr:MAG: NAD-dependent epimerase/dehydratase family protein [Deltaproteobacteria bacterium]
MRIVITGANGAIGQEVLRLALSQSIEVVAAVRSKRAAGELPPLAGTRGRAARIDYASSQTLVEAFEGAQSLIHLPGVLVERAGSSYERSNVETTRVALEAARSCGLKKIVLVSAVGADPDSSNRYFRSKGEAENSVRSSGLSYTILRAPLVLGPGTEGTRALVRNTSRRSAWLLGGGRHLQQPLDVKDLALACLRSATQTELARSRTLDLAGPERLSDRELNERAAQLLERSVRIRSLPVTPVRWLLAARTRLLGPGLSPDAIEVLVTDTRVDAEAAAKELGISLTPLEQTLQRSLQPAEAT